jgi:hypothetical protein
MRVVFRVMRDGCFRDDPPLALLPDYQGFEVEKDFSTAQLANGRAASVEMTVAGFG